MFCRHTQLLDFYPRPPRGGRPHPVLPAVGRSRYFYPRPPRGERPISLLAHTRTENFYPRPPRGERPPASVHTAQQAIISIHALREESDPSSYFALYLVLYFYPRPPRGERQQKQRENTLLLSHYTPLCTNCKEMSVNQTAKSHRYLRKRLVFRCEASRETMCAAGSHWPDIKRSARCLGQILGAVQCARPWSGSCCPAGRTADCPRQGRSGRSALL